MQTKMMRRRMRMLLGQWGGWPVMQERLRREKDAARAWAQAEPDGPAALLAEQIERELNDLVRLRLSISPLVLGLTRDEQQVLLLRYESGWSWVKIAAKMHCDERTARRIEEHAVDELSRYLGE